MILLAYGSVVVAMVWLLARVRHPTIVALPEGVQLLVRLLALALALALAWLSILQLDRLIDESWHSFGSDRLPFLLWGTELLGSILYVLGALVWRGRLALALRLVGWVAMVGAFAVPNWSVIMLLPFLALLVVTLREVPLRRAGDKARKPHPHVRTS